MGEIEVREIRIASLDIPEVVFAATRVGETGSAIGGVVLPEVLLPEVKLPKVHIPEVVISN